MMKLKILFVDDEPMILQGFRRMLRGMRNEWEMAFAASGPEALEILDREAFDVVVSDMKMPKMDGAQLLSEVQKRHPGIIRIILSGHSDQEMILKTVRSAHQFLSKPCEEQLLKNTIQRAYAVRSLLGQQTLKNIISQTDALPSLPSVYADLMDAIQSPKSSIEQIGKIITGDLAMTAKILQLVNSAFFGLPRRISEPAQAVNLLGIDTVKALVLTVGVFSAFDGKRLNGFHIDQLWNHSLQAGAMARAIARIISEDKHFVEDAFMAGLLHDVGKLVLIACIPDVYSQVMENIRNQSVSLCDAENGLLHTTHAEVGAYLMGLWGIPDSIVEAVGFHHRPETCPSDRPIPLTVVHAADVFEHGSGSSKTLPGTGPELNDAYLEKLGLIDKIGDWQAACSQIRSGEPTDE